LSDGSYVFPEVGFARNLRLSVTTDAPPCLASATRSFHLASPTVEETFTLDPTLPYVLGCLHTLSTPFAGSGEPLPPDNPVVQWQQADVSNIDVDPMNSGAWHAGRVTDILTLDDNGGLVVATDSGGVWAIPFIGPAQPLSDTWSTLNMRSLAFGPDNPRHIYAGAMQDSDRVTSEILWETDTSAADPLSNWRPINVPSPCDSIARIVVDRESRRIVVACTLNIWWSQIPASPSAQGTYNWKEAVLDPSNEAFQFSGLALGPMTSQGHQIVASVWGTQSSAPVGHGIIFHGNWSNGDLIFTRASVPVNSFTLSLGRTTVASCTNNPFLMYAVAEAGGSTISSPFMSDGEIAYVWKSGDGGQHWDITNVPSGAGPRGFHNNAITISPDCGTVALGWQAGPFVSSNAGGSWVPLQDPGGHLHADVEALSFAPSDSTFLYIGSDGGVASAAGIQKPSPVFASFYNHHLYNLQLYRMTASWQTTGLVAEALQDNGVVYAQLPGRWQPLIGGDGINSAFLSHPPVLTAGNDILLDGIWGGGNNPPWNWAQSDGNINPVFALSGQQTIPLGTDPDGVADGTAVKSILGVVRNPAFRNSAQQLMYAVTESNATIYGLFANDDGSGIHWENLGSIGADQDVTALASYDGTHIFIGTVLGTIYRLNSPYGGPAAQLTVNIPDPNLLPNIENETLIEPLPETAFASVSSHGITPGVHAHVLAWTPETQSWNALDGGLPSDFSFKAVAYEDFGAMGLGNLYVATASHVFVTYNLGQSWFTVSDGLPAACQARDLRIAIQPDGKKYLYLATFGRSLWRASLPATGDFSLQITPPQIRHRFGQFAVNVTPLVGFNGVVSLTCSSNSATNCDVSPTTIVGGGSATLTVTSDNDGDNDITVTGTSGALTHSATVTLTVPCKAPRCM
jgi:hypothetical protein